MGAAADGDATAGSVHDLLAALEKLGNVTEARSAVGIGEEGVLAPDVPQPVRNATSLAAVCHQGDESQDVVQPVFMGEAKDYVSGGIKTAIVHNQDFIAARVGGGSMVQEMGARMSTRGGARSALAADVLVQIGDGLFQCRHDAFFFIESGEYDAQEELGWLYGARVGGWRGILCSGRLLGESPLSQPAVVPARERPRRWGLARGTASSVGFLRGEDGSRFWRDQVKKDKELEDD